MSKAARNHKLSTFSPFLHTGVVSLHMLFLQHPTVDLLGHFQPSCPSHLLASSWAVAQPLVFALLLVVCCRSLSVPESTLPFLGFWASALLLFFLLLLGDLLLCFFLCCRFFWTFIFLLNTLLDLACLQSRLYVLQVIIRQAQL